MGNCCNQKRMALSESISSKKVGSNPSPHLQGFTHQAAKALNRLKYIGTTSLMIRGGASRKIYNFYSPQVVLEVEPGDLSSIASNPFLVKIL